MGINGLHLVTVSVGDALKHVLDVADDGADGGNILSASEPFLHLNPLQQEKNNKKNSQDN